MHDGLGRLLDARQVQVLPAKVEHAGEAQLKDGLIIAPEGLQIPCQRRNECLGRLKRLDREGMSQIGATRAAMQRGSVAGRGAGLDIYDIVAAVLPLGFIGAIVL